MSEAPSLHILDGGLASSFQDFGRRGYQRFGISESGALDPGAMRLANAMVANPPHMPVIEITLSGPTLRIDADRCRIALAGAPFTVSVNGERRPAEQALDLNRGDVVRFGPPAWGMRAYIAVAGGFDVAPVLGSVSTHSRSQLGGLDGGFLKEGDRLTLLQTGAPSSAPLRRDTGEAPRGERTVRVLLGPQADAFTDKGIETFLGAAYTLTPKADRMGCQFEGPAIEHRDGFNIVSDGIVNGSIQVPGNGCPIVLLADRQTTGGYPKIATVIAPDLTVLAQLRVGETLRFEAIEVEEAEQAEQRYRAAFERAERRLAPVEGGVAIIATETLLSNNLISGVHGAI